MSKMNLNTIRDRVYKTISEHGLHDKGLSNEHYLCLVISALMEAVEADRKNKNVNIERYNCDLLYLKNNKKQVYEYYIKGSVEEKMANAIILLFNLAGFKRINFYITKKDINECAKYMTEICKGKKITESIYYISALITEYEKEFSFYTAVNAMVLLILGFAKHLGVDLIWYIEQKIKYNELNEEMHGKKY